MKTRWLMPGGRRTLWLVVAWLLAGLGLSVLTFVLLWNKQVHAQTADLSGRCNNGALVLQGELFNQVFSAGMYNGLIHAFPNISAADFQTFATFTNYILPYCEGIAYVRSVPGDQRAVLEAQLGTTFKQYAPGLTNLSIPAFVTRANASEYLVSWRISNKPYQQFYEGYDLLSDPGATRLAIAARDTSLPVLSAPFAAPLGQGTSLSVFWPFYTQNPFLYRTVAARRANFKGLVMAVFNVKSLFDSVVGKFTTTLEELSIFDTTNATDPKRGGTLFYNVTKLTPEERRHGKKISAVRSQALGGRMYRIECEQFVSVGDLLADSLPWSCLVLLFVTLVALTILLVTRRFQRDREEVQRVEKLNKDLDVARQTAVSADKAKSSFLAMMSHELRTPMTGTLGMLDLLRLTPMTEEQSLYVTTMQGSAESLLACLNDILDFSKIEAGQLRLEEIDFDIRDVVQQVTTLFSGKLQEKGLQIHTNLPPPNDCKARGDPLRLQQVLTNLISNAIKFTDRGSISINWRRLHGAHLNYGGGHPSSFSSFRADVAVDIDEPADKIEEDERPVGCLPSALRRRRVQTLSRVSSDASNGSKMSDAPAGSLGSPRSSESGQDSDGLWYEFSVTDTGLGITEEVQQRLFQSFVQADDSTTRMFGGTGLGLVICKKLVTAMGGSISVQSQVGEGSTFTCVVYLRPQQPGTPSVVELQPSDGRHSNRLSELTSQLISLSEAASQPDPSPSDHSLTETVPEAQPQVGTSHPDSTTVPPSQTAGNYSHSQPESLLETSDRNTVNGTVSGGLSERNLSGVTSSLEQGPEFLGGSTSQNEPGSVTCLRGAGEMSGSESRVGRRSEEAPVVYGDSPPERQSAPKIWPLTKEATKDIEPAAHILVAEDNVVNQMLIKRMLKQFGHSVDIVGNGALAVEAVKTNDYALCLMDLQMPVLDGIGATEQIRRLDPPKCNLPIYVLSADVLAQEKFSQDLKFDGYLTKPIKWDVLLASVEEKLKAKGLLALKA
ncbi:histidine kinase [Klebsormidium nitens]|uniref:histidine kinase n=1 Tax=Klebsormidium nitens TaxID=105231 RepID=A0A1Y1HJ66_KLENI|nr:histidine kinase [Klebsormidium nitens]|eukprot:GAQ78570.1 histidine kinase [Klebsormidium nitens]